MAGREPLIELSTPPRPRHTHRWVKLTFIPEVVIVYFSPLIRAAGAPYGPTVTDADIKGSDI